VDLVVDNPLLVNVYNKDMSGKSGAKDKLVTIFGYLSKAWYFESSFGQPET
jgi:hypothetical protein